MDPRANLLLNGHSTKLPSKFVFVLTNHHSREPRLYTESRQSARVSAVCSVIYRTPRSYTFAQRVREHVEEGALGRQQTEAGHLVLRTTVLMNSQQLWWPGHHLHKIDPVNIGAWVKEGA